MESQAASNALARSSSVPNNASRSHTSAGSIDEDAMPQTKKLRRSFKACAHCRSRKAKCDLGDLNNPREPPCARCKREGVPCEFLPSKRGGRVPFAARQAKLGSEAPQQQDQTFVDSDYSSSGTSNNRSNQHQVYYPDANIPVSPRFASSLPAASAAGLDHTYFEALSSMPPRISDAPLFDAEQSAHRAVPQPVTNTANAMAGPSRETVEYSPVLRSMTNWNATAVSPPHGPTRQDTRHSHMHGSGPYQTSTSAFLPGSASMAIDNPGKISTASPSGDSQLSQNSTQRRKRKAETLVEPDTLAAAKLHNPVDALNLLVLAAEKGKHRNVEDSLAATSRPGEGASTGLGNDRGEPMGSPASSDSDAAPRPPYTLSDFPLVKKKIISQMELIYYINLFFSKVHHIFPVIPYKRIPTNEAELTTFVKDEVHLASVFILLASRNDVGGSRGFDIHNAAWSFLQELISDLVFGKAASVGAVEALLLLSDNPPREVVKNGPPGSAEESRMSWMLVGIAVRLGYMLGLDQTTLVPSIADTDSTPEGIDARERLDRERIAWTYCYIFDRQLSIRTGKAFWSRGPGLCFTGSSEKSFPSMAPVEGMQDDFAGLILAHVEITQIMTNAHDILYPSRDRTISLVKIGEYYKFLDELTRTLNNFRFTWENKKWKTYPLTELVWITFHYLRLYVYAFAFQANIQRAGIRDFAPVVPHTGKPIPVTSMFPKGPLGSPDAKFILEAIDAAADLIRICTERLHPQGILAFLPWRYFLYLTYAGVFLLKAVYVNAVPGGNQHTIIKLIKRLIVCLACGSKDVRYQAYLDVLFQLISRLSRQEHHHSVRYARLLNSLLRSFSRGQDGLGTASATPLGRRTPEGTPQPEAPVGQDIDWSQRGSSALQTTRLVGPASAFASTPASAPAPSEAAGQQSALFATSEQPNSSTSDFFYSSMLNPTSNQYLTDGLPSNTAQEERTAADLLTDTFSLDFVFSGAEPSSSTFDYNNLMDETTWDFWASLSSNNPMDQ